MAYSYREYRAILAVAAHKGYKLQLCRRPLVYFDHHGEMVKQRIREVLAEYNALRKEEARAKKQQASNSEPRIV